MYLGKLQERVRGREAWRDAVHGVAESRALSNNSSVHSGIFDMDDQEHPTAQPRNSVQSSMAAWTGGGLGENGHMYKCD